EFISTKSVKLHLKKYKNFALSLIHHLFIKRTIPEGFFSAHEFWKSVKEKITDFQSRILKKNLILAIDKAQVLESFNKKSPNNEYLETLKVLFLSGQAKLESNSKFSAHMLLINIDEVGDLYFIEHKNGKP